MVSHRAHLGFLALLCLIACQSNPAVVSAASSVPVRATPASAEPAKGDWHRFGLSSSVGLFADVSTEVRVDSSRLGRGTKFDLESELGVEESTEIFRGDGFVRFNRRHRIDGSYFAIDRRGTRTIDRQITVGDTTFPVNGRLTTSFDTEIFKGAYRYVFAARDTWEAGVSVGVHWMRTELGVGSQALSLTEQFKTEIPLPVVGVHGEWLLTDTLRCRASTELFYLQLSDLGTSTLR